MKIRVGMKLRRVCLGPPDLTNGKVYEVIRYRNPAGDLFDFAVIDDGGCKYPSYSNLVKGFPECDDHPFWEVVEGGTLNGMDKVFPEGETT